MEAFAFPNHEKHDDGLGGYLTPRVLKQGWLSKKGKLISIWKAEQYFVLLEDGRFLSFSSKPDTNPCCVKPRRVFLLRAVSCLGVYVGQEYFKTIYSNRKENQLVSNGNYYDQMASSSNCGNQPETGVALRIKRNTFSVCLLKTGEIVERTYCTATSEDRDEWTNAFAEVKRLLSAKNKNLNDFEIIAVLGAGYFGKVVLCRDKSSGHPYAMKLIRKAKVAGLKELKFTLAEKHLLQKLTYPFLIHMKYSFQTPDKLCFVTEFLPGGELFRYVHQFGHISEKTAKFYAAEVVCAIGFLHKCNVVYRDLKLENILIDKEGHIRLIDLGLCKALMSASEKTRTFCGTRGCMAPEVLDYELYGMSVDWWGVGIAMYEMLCGKLPFADSNSSQGQLQIIKTEEVKFTQQLGRDVMDVVKALLQKDPKQRLGCAGRDAQEVQQHLFFQDIIWDDVPAKKLVPPFVPELSSDFDTRYFDDSYTTASIETVTEELKDEQLTSLERNKFDRISDYSEESSESSDS